MSCVSDEMVSRFLMWRLPDDFAPDAGISFTRVYNERSPWGPMNHEPVGTNLLNAPQARAMLEHVVGECGTSPADARLLGAARDLLAALQGLVAAVEDPDADSLHELIAAHAAIAKATQP